MNYKSKDLSDFVIEQHVETDFSGQQICISFRTVYRYIIILKDFEGKFREAL